MIGPNKDKLYPNENIKTVCYISNLPKKSNVQIGEYTYYSDNTKSQEKFYDSIEHLLGDKLIIGKFCAIVEDVKFIMNGANHRRDGITTYPFNIFEDGAIIAANSTVVKSVESYVIYGGNPAKFIKKRFIDENIA